jgi:uncharacterized membrane protein HdeD (DUF308 family)
MEMTRGLMTIACGLLFLTARSFAPRLFIYSLGVYLVIDGLLELYGLHRRKSVSQHKARAFDYAGGAMSLLTGLLSLVVPTLTLFLLAAIIAVRLIISGFLQLRTVRRSCGLSAAFLWLSSSLFVLLGFSLLLFPLLVITFLVVLLGIYMLGSGLVLLLRGLSLRFKFVSLPASLTQPSQASPGLIDDLPASTRRAVVFVRRPAATGLGHIAWGFEWMNGWFNVGSVENTTGKPFANPEEMGFWSTHTLDPVATVQNREHPYDEYKLFFVLQPHPKEAWKTVIWESQEPYSVVHHNCCDVVYDILRAYGCTQLLDPAKEFVPNDWYDALPGTSYTIAEHPAIAVSLRKQSPREIARREFALLIPTRMQGAPPPWRMQRWRAWEELTLVWEMVIGHVRTVCASAFKFITQRLHRGAPQP